MTCNSISVISGWWVDDNERLCTMEPHLQLKRSLPQARLKSGTTRSVGQRLTYRGNRAPFAVGRSDTTEGTWCENLRMICSGPHLY